MPYYTSKRVVVPLLRFEMVSGVLLVSRPNPMSRHFNQGPGLPDRRVAQAVPECDRHNKKSLWWLQCLPARKQEPRQFDVAGHSTPCRGLPMANALEPKCGSLRLEKLGTDLVKASIARCWAKEQSEHAIALRCLRFNGVGPA
jgi:hypothetical protein